MAPRSSAAENDPILAKGTTSAPEPGTETLAPPAPAETPASPPSKLDELLDAWFNETMHNSPVSRDTAIFNHVRGAVNDLKRRLSSL